MGWYSLSENWLWHSFCYNWWLCVLVKSGDEVFQPNVPRYWKAYHCSWGEISQTPVFMTHGLMVFLRIVFFSLQNVYCFSLEQQSNDCGHFSSCVPWTMCDIWVILWKIFSHGYLMFTVYTWSSLMQPGSMECILYIFTLCTENANISIAYDIAGNCSHCFATYFTSQQK